MRTAEPSLLAHQTVRESASGYRSISDLFVSRGRDSLPGDSDEAEIATKCRVAIEERELALEHWLYGNDIKKTTLNAQRASNLLEQYSGKPTQRVVVNSAKPLSSDNLANLNKQIEQASQK